MAGRLAQNTAVHMGVAFLAMGCWAAFANRTHPMPGPLLAGVVQGSLSAVITLVLKRMIESIGRRFDGPASLWLPPLVATVLSLGILASIHALAGTPEIAATIALPASVTAVYSTIYSLALWRGRKAA
ncbi:MAG: hypothetical protein JNL61_15330 [Rhizobiaceae bacterium]|nr:hypothetical protein [Rhizobiaceae bacterium]